MLKALLVDDEINNLNSLEFMLLHDCEGIAVTGKAQNAAQARDCLLSEHIDIIFLDINMPGEDGFQFLKSIVSENYNIIFITAYNEYALQAIKASAVDYILKPVNIDELQKAVEKVKRLAVNPVANRQGQVLVQHLVDTINKRQPPNKIALPQLGSISFIDVDDIVSLQADSNYTIIHLQNMQKVVISKTLREFEDLLDGHPFVRIHKSYIVNLKYVREYCTTDGGIVKMTDGNQWSVSRRQLDAFLSKMKQASLMFTKDK
ncbi:MAG TPA: LytTR family DNA-binding domain-containing protein [Mucilaginibacter sp.]|nr:LytTR family DNA-binding domain-containing protein [Mucilaginibacter sp.]